VRCLVNGRNPQSQRCVYRNNNTLCVPKLYLYVLCITQLIQITFLHASSEFKFTTKSSLVSDLLLSSSIFKLASRLPLNERLLFALAASSHSAGCTFTARRQSTGFETRRLALRLTAVTTKNKSIYLML
jgi:hypothetical protein